jgi:hypothetical protein
MTTSQRLIFIVATLLGLAAATGTALTTWIGLEQTHEASLALAVSALLGLVSGASTAVGTASALAALINSGSPRQSPKVSRPGNTRPNLRNSLRRSTGLTISPRAMANPEISSLKPRTPSTSTRQRHIHANDGQQDS